jgi:hypothetical protein
MENVECVGWVGAGRAKRRATLDERAVGDSGATDFLGNPSSFRRESGTTAISSSLDRSASGHRLGGNVHIINKVTFADTE